MTDKLMELVLYIAGKSKDDKSFGLTKLNKILFAADFFHFGAFGKSITEAKYIHHHYGGVPNEMQAVLQLLKSRERVEIRESLYCGYQQRRVVPLKGADTSMFNDSELSFVDEWIDFFKNYNGKSLSQWSHEHLPYRLTRQGEEIPYCSIFGLYKEPVTQEDNDWARQEIKKMIGISSGNFV